MITRWMMFKLIAPTILAAVRTRQFPLKPGVYIEGWRGPAGETVLIAVGEGGLAVAEPRYVSTPAELAEAMQELYDLLPQREAGNRRRAEARRAAQRTA